MRINVDRLAELAGLSTGRRRTLSEASNRSMHDDASLSGEAEYRYGKNQLSEESELMYGSPEDQARDLGLEGMSMREEDEDLPEGMMREEETEEGMMREEDLEEMIEVDEVMLVQELRRAKKALAESKNRRTRRTRNSRRSLQEAELKNIIDQEVKNVLQDLNLGGGWVYGDNKPKRSRKGYVNQGSFLKGIGFK